MNKPMPLDRCVNCCLLVRNAEVKNPKSSYRSWALLEFIIKPQADLSVKQHVYMSSIEDAHLYTDKHAVLV